jgi:hypothetical protein
MSATRELAGALSFPRTVSGRDFAENDFVCLSTWRGTRQPAAVGARDHLPAAHCALKRLCVVDSGNTCNETDPFILMGVCGKATPVARGIRPGPQI